MENVDSPAAGDMVALVHAHDWRSTPLGPVEAWPARLRVLVDTLLCNPAPCALLWGAEGTLIYNAGYALICGARHPHVLGMPVRSAWPEAADFNGRVLADGLAGRTQVFNRVAFMLERDGAPREAWFDLYYGPVPDDGGRIAGVLATVVEITDQVRAEQARDAQQRQLQQTMARLRALTNATADVIYRVSPDWRELRQLDGRGFIKDTATPRLDWIEEYLPADERARLDAAIRRAMARRSVFELEHRVLRVDGSVGWTLSRAVPMFDADGVLQEWIGTASDITERKLAEEKLRESDRRKDEFLAMLAHELRNPLAPIGTAAELLQTARLDDTRIRLTSQIIGRQVAHMTALVDDLLDVSRVTRGLITLEPAQLDLNRVVCDAVEQAAPLADARRHALVLDLPPEPILVTGDQKRLVQIVANILNNAAKYTREGGRIEVGVRVVRDGAGGSADSGAERWAEIRVADNGIGMAADVAARAFELFAQAERTSDRSTGGLGLGLALVRSLAELHGGSVSCTSPGPGQGSTFTVRLPAHAATAAACAPEAAPARSARALQILVVDDNADAASMLALLLESDGHEVRVEHDARRALEQLADDPPQVCLIDIGLPGMDGNTLARHLRTLPAMAGATLIAVTGYGQDSDRQRSLAAGFDHHMVKPVDVEALYAVLEEVVVPGIA